MYISVVMSMICSISRPIKSQHITLFRALVPILDQLEVYPKLYFPYPCKGFMVVSVTSNLLKVKIIDFKGNNRFETTIKK